MALVTRSNSYSRITSAVNSAKNNWGNNSSTSSATSSKTTSSKTTSSTSTASTSTTSSSKPSTSGSGNTSSASTKTSTSSASTKSSTSSSSSTSTKTSSSSSSTASSTNLLTAATAAVTGAVSTVTGVINDAATTVTGAISSALRISQPNTETQAKNNAGQIQTSAPTSTTQASTSTLKTPDIGPSQAANENPLQTLIKTNSEEGKAAIQNYQDTVAENRAEAKAANTQAAQDFIDFIDAGYESDNLADNARSLALDILLPTSLVRNELDREAGTLDQTDPVRAVETVADVVSLIPVAGGLMGSAAKLAAKGISEAVETTANLITKTTAKTADTVATSTKTVTTATKATATAPTATTAVAKTESPVSTATKAITQETDMAISSGLTKAASTLLKKIVSPTPTQVKAKTAEKLASTQLKQTKVNAKAQIKQTAAKANAEVKIAKANAKATTTTAKNAAKATQAAPKGSKAVNALKTTAAVGSAAVTGLWGYSLVNDIMNPEEDLTTFSTTRPTDDPLYTEDSTFYDTGIYDTGIGGAYNTAEQTAEEILEPLEDIPVIGEAVAEAAESNLSLPLLLGIVAAIGITAYLVYKNTAKKSGNRKPRASKTPKQKTKGAAA